MSDTHFSILCALIEQASCDREWQAALKLLTLLISTLSNTQTEDTGAKSRIKSITLKVFNSVQEEDEVNSLLKNDMCKIFQTVLCFFCADAQVLLSLSCLYFSKDLFEYALQAAQTALALDEKNATALEIVENICCHVIDRWHFIMLNDISRNRAYKSSLSQISSHKGSHFTVLDVGCGTGILSFYAANSCKQVYAVERSSVMCKIAERSFEKCLEEGKIPQKITLYNKMSSDLKVGEDLDCKLDVIVTEIFDAGLFGEGILSTLAHAWKQLLKSTTDHEKSIVIPGKAALFVEVIQSEDLRNETVFDSWSYDLTTDNLKIVSNVGMIESDPYTSIHLKNLPAGFRRLSRSKQFLEVNFNDPQNVIEMNKGLCGDLKLEIEDEGVLDAVIVWFKLHLYDTVEVSTNVESGGCWEQAVFPVSQLRLLEKPGLSDSSNIVKVFHGDQISLVYSIEEDRLSMNVTSVCASNRPPIVTEKPAAFPSPSQLLSHPLEWCHFDVYCLSDWEIKMLNSKSYQDKLLSGLQRLASNEPFQTCHFVHINEAFSPLCLQALSYGFHQVHAVIQQDCHKALFWKLVQINGLDVNKINSVEDISEIEIQNSPDSTASCHLESPSSSTQSHCLDKAVVVFDLVDHTGRLVENWTDTFESIRSYAGNFRFRHIIPWKVDIWGVFIESESLLKQNRVVSDNNTLGYPVKEFINKFSTMNHPDLCLAVLKHKKLTTPFKMFTLDFGKEIDDVKQTSPSDFQSVCDRTEEETGIIESCILDRLPPASLKVPVVTEGKLDALVYWFDLHLSPTHCVSTLDLSNPWHQAAVILDRGHSVLEEVLNVKFSLKNSTIFVSFLN